MEDLEKYGYYYKASWTEMQKELTVNIESSTDGKSYAKYYVKKLVDGGYEITLQAFTEVNYIFEGWDNVVVETENTTERKYGTNYSYVVSENTKNIDVRGIFNPIKLVKIKFQN